MWSMRNSGRAAASKSNHSKAIGWAIPRFGAAVMAFLQLSNVLHAQLQIRGPPPRREQSLNRHTYRVRAEFWREWLQ